MRRLILAAVVLIVVAAPVLATTASQKAVKCPVCATETRVFEIMSTNNFGGTDRDLLRRAAGSQPLMLMATTCPKCHYSTWASSFEKPVDDEVKKAILAGALKMPAYEAPKSSQDEEGHTTTLPAWVRHDLALQCLVLKKASNDRLSWQAINTSWAVRLGENPFGKRLPDDKTWERLVKASGVIGEKAADKNRADLEVELGRTLIANAAKAADADRGPMLIMGASMLRSHGEHQAVLDALPALLATLPEAERADLEKRVRASIALERGYQKMTLDYLTKRLAGDEKYSEPGEKAVLIYVSGELNRRLGNPAEAVRLYDLAVSEKLPKGLETWAREQRALVAPR